LWVAQERRGSLQAQALVKLQGRYASRLFKGAYQAAYRHVSVCCDLLQGNWLGMRLDEIILCPLYPLMEMRAICQIDTILTLGMTATEIDHQTACELCGEERSSYLLDQGQRQVDASGNASACGHSAIANEECSLNVLGSCVAFLQCSS